MESQNFVSKVSVKLYCINWKIEKFTLLAKNQAWIDLQACEFETIAEGLDDPLKWKISLQQLEKSGCEDKWISVWINLLDCPDSWSNRAFQQTAMRLTLSEDGDDNFAGSKMFPIGDCTTRIGWEKGVDLNLNNTSLITEDGALCITIFMRLIILPVPGSVASKVPHDLQTVLKNFQAESTPTAHKALRKSLLNTEIPCTEVKIVTSDAMEFVAQWGVLAARTPYFARMYEANMIERETGIIEVKTISGKTMEVLHHFIYSGELLPSWMEEDVIVELTNAAAMYELTDLLKFLDEVLGKICKEATAIQLASLARKLSLKKAEEGLLEWIKKNVSTSKVNLFSILEPLPSIAM